MVTASSEEILMDVKTRYTDVHHPYQSQVGLLTMVPLSYLRGARVPFWGIDVNLRLREESHTFLVKRETDCSGGLRWVVQTSQ